MGETTPVGVLHVDDDPAMRELLVAFLERRGLEPRLRTAATAAEATELLKSDPAAVDVVVSDMSLPDDEGGLGFLEDVRAEYPDLPFVVFTGRDDREDLARERGATDYVVKGTVRRLETLAARIDELVDEADRRAAEPIA